jgi:hypothetical protein
VSMNIEVSRAISGDEVGGDPCIHLLLHADSVTRGNSSQAGGLAIRDSLEVLSSFPELLIRSQGRPLTKARQVGSATVGVRQRRRRRILN